MKKLSKIKFKPGNRVFYWDNYENPRIYSYVVDSILFHKNSVYYCEDKPNGRQICGTKLFGSLKKVIRDIKSFNINH